MAPMIPLPNRSPSWSQDDPSHPGYIVTGVDDTAGRKAYFILLEVKEGKQDLLRRFLRDINDGVNKEPKTGPWFGLQYSETTFCVFEAFPNAQARHDHDAGPGGVNFLKSEMLLDMLAYPAHLYRLDVLHGKFDVMFGCSMKSISDGDSDKGL